MAVGIRRADYVTPLYPQKLTLTSPTSGGRSRTEATVFGLVFSNATTFILKQTVRQNHEKENNRISSCVCFV
jgi:hypothetical protein